jgi:undecaprenyl-diphosphatase
LTVLNALILGVVQGLTEFLPVSSSGHLVIVPELFNLPAPTLAFDILVHVATLVAVVGYFIRDVSKIVLSIVAPRRLRNRQEVKHWRRIFLWLVIGSIPAGLAGFLLSDFFESLFDSTLAVGLFLLVTSLLLWGADFALGRVKPETLRINKMRAADALIVGCFQALAIAPGLSRSGSTISAGVFLGFDRESAARFSFLLSIPAILGAFVFKLKDVGGAFAGGSGEAYVVGAIAAAISGFAAVYFLMRWLREHRLRGFAIYTALLGIFVVVLSAV